MSPQETSTDLHQVTKKRRVRTGCLTCRSRKVKCDERGKECGACRRMGLVCRWPELRVVNGDVHPVRSRQEEDNTGRRSQSPEQIHMQTKGLDPSSIHYHVMESNDSVDIESPTNLREIGPRSRCPTSPPPADCRSTLMNHDRLLPKSSLLHAHLNAWFRFVHPCQGSGFLHRGILLRDIREGRASNKLVVAVCATAGRFFNGASTVMGLDPSKPLKPDTWSYDAKQMVLMDEEVSLNSVAACLALSRHFTHCGRLSLADTLTAMATRQASMLGLFDPTSYDTLPWVEQEYRRRLAWGCYCYERLGPLGKSDMMHVITTPIELRLPTEDHTYQLSIPMETPSADFEGRIVGYHKTLNNVGLMGHLVTLLGVRDEASRILHSLRQPLENNILPWNPLSPFTLVIDRLKQWRLHLPSFMDVTADNAYARSLQSEEGALVLLHARFHSIMWALYQVSIIGNPEYGHLVDVAPSDWLEASRNAVLEHVTSFGELIALHDQHFPSHPITDPSLPLMVWEAVRIHTSLATGRTPVSLGETVERICKPVVRTVRLFWLSGVVIRAVCDILHRQSVATNLNPTQAGPAASSPLPSWMKEVLLLHFDELSQSNPTDLPDQVSSVNIPHLLGFVTPEVFLSNTPWDLKNLPDLSFSQLFDVTNENHYSNASRFHAGHADLLEALFPEATATSITSNVPNGVGAWEFGTCLE